MKSKYAPVVVVLAMVSLTVSCNDETPSQAEKAQQMLTANTWIAENVTVDGVDETDRYSKLELQFKAGEYIAKNGEPVWPSEGTWNFKSPSETSVIIRDNTVEIRVNEVTDTDLVLELTWEKTTIGHGRSRSISGIHVFKFKINA